MTLDQTNSVGREKEREKERREKDEREERKMREKLQLLSTIYGDWWVGFHRAKN